MGMMRSALGAKIHALITSGSLLGVIHGNSLFWTEKIQEATGCDLSDLKDDLDKGLPKQYINSVEIRFMISPSQKPTAVIWFEYDWKKYTFAVKRNGEKVALQNPNDPISLRMKASFKQVSKIIKEVWTGSGAKYLKVYYGYNPEKIRTVGFARIQRELGHHTDPKYTAISGSEISSGFGIEDDHLKGAASFSMGILKK